MNLLREGSPVLARYYLVLFMCLGYEWSQQWIDELKMLVRKSQIDIYILKNILFSN